MKNIKRTNLEAKEVYTLNTKYELLGYYTIAGMITLLFFDYDEEKLCYMLSQPTEEHLKIKFKLFNKKEYTTNECINSYINSTYHKYTGSHLYVTLTNDMLNGEYFIINDKQFTGGLSKLNDLFRIADDNGIYCYNYFGCFSECKCKRYKLIGYEHYEDFSRYFLLDERNNKHFMEIRSSGTMGIYKDNGKFDFKKIIENNMIDVNITFPGDWRLLRFIDLSYLYNFLYNI